jgi:ribosomal protein L44E
MYYIQSIYCKFTKYHSDDQIEKLRWAKRVARSGERRHAYRVLVGKYEKRGPLGRPRHRCENNIKMDLQEVGCGSCTRFIWLMIGTGGGLL